MDTNFDVRKTNDEIIELLKVLDYQENKAKTLDNIAFMASNIDEILINHQLFKKYTAQLQNKEHNNRMSQHDLTKFSNYISRLTNKSQGDLPIDVIKVYSDILEFLTYNPATGPPEVEEEWETTGTNLEFEVESICEKLCRIF